VVNLNVKQTNNGYIVVVNDSVRFNGDYVFRFIDEFKMVEFIAKAMFDKNVKVEEK